MRVIMGPGTQFIAIGLVIGITLALGATRLLSTMVFGVAVTDPATFVQVAAVLAAASLLACAVPAIRVRRDVQSDSWVSLKSQ